MSLVTKFGDLKEGIWILKKTLEKKGKMSCRELRGKIRRKYFTEEMQYENDIWEEQEYLFEEYQEGGNFCHHAEISVATICYIYPTF